MGGEDAVMGEAGAGEATVLKFELFPAHSLSLCLVEGVSNAAALREQVL